MDYDELVKRISILDEQDVYHTADIERAKNDISNAHGRISMNAVCKSEIITEAFLDFTFSDLWKDSFSYKFFLIQHRLFGKIGNADGVRAAKHKMNACREFGSYIRSFSVSEYAWNGRVESKFFITIPRVDELDDSKVALTVDAMEKIAAHNREASNSVDFEVRQNPLNKSGVIIVTKLDENIWDATVCDVNGDEKDFMEFRSAAEVFAWIKETY